MELRKVKIRDLFTKTADLVDKAAAEVYSRPQVIQGFSGYYTKPEKQGDPHCFCILAACEIYLNNRTTTNAIILFDNDINSEDWWDTPAPDEILAQADIAGNIWLDQDLSPAIETRYTGLFYDLIGEVLNDKYKLTPPQISAKLREFASSTPEEAEVTIDGEGYVVPKEQLKQSE